MCSTSPAFLLFLQVFQNLQFIRLSPFHGIENLRIIKYGNKLSLRIC